MIFGIVGFIGSGKNTVGDILINDYGFQSESFAKPVKDTLSSIFGWDRELIEGNTPESRIFRELPDEWWEKSLDWTNSNFSKTFPRFSPRTAMQIFGTEVFRKNFSDNIWVSSLEHRLETNKNKNIIVTDCRFPNELASIKNYGGKIIRVKRGDDPDWWDIAVTANTKPLVYSEIAKAELTLKGIHISEYAWVGSNFDIVIENNSTLDYLKQVVKDILKDYGL